MSVRRKKPSSGLEHFPCRDRQTRRVADDQGQPDQLDQPAEGHLGAARATTTAHRTVRTTPHPRPPVGHPDRPCHQRHSRSAVARRPGSPLRAYRYRADHRAGLSLVGLVSQSHRAVILVRDDRSRTRDRDDRGYGLPLVTTDLESVAEDVVARYASRWGIEQAFAEARQIVGVGEARNRTRRAVERTVPFGLICFSVVTVWYALHGQCADDVTSHRARAAGTPQRPNRPSTTWPSSSAGSSSPPRFRGPRPDQATPQETRAVLAAWAAAGT
jgi:hypothetical protein